MSVLQNRPARAALAATILLAMIAAMLMFMPKAEAQGTSTTVTATALSDARIRVQWTPVTGVTEYDVRLVRGAGTGGGLNDVTSRAVSSGYTSRSLLPNTEYSVRVFNAGNNAELGRTDVTTSARLAPGSVPRTRSIDISEREFAVVWMPAPRATSYKVEHRRHDEQFTDNGEISVPSNESLEHYLYAGSGNANTRYYVRITPQRDEAPDGPSYIHSIRTMAAGQSKPWDEYTFENATLSEAPPCNGGVLPLSRQSIYDKSSAVQKYVDTCMIDIGSSTSGTFRKRPLLRQRT